MNDAPDNKTRTGASTVIEDLGTVLYQRRDAVATVTMNRPEVRNALNSALIDDIDKAFEKADADDAIHVVVLAAAGDHFCAGHDLTELNEPASQDDWARMRATTEGKLRHEQVMYYDRCTKIRDFRKPTVARVQGACVAAGMMLAPMCDLIVAADDAWFANPVAAMSGAGVEILVEPFEFGFRKAKEFLLTGLRLDAIEAQHLGLVNRVVPRAELATSTDEIASQIAGVPPITAQMIKRSLNDAQDLAGMRAAWRNHFMIHQFTSATETAKGMDGERRDAASNG